MNRAFVELELAEHALSQCALGEHSPNSFFHRKRRASFDQAAIGHLFQAAHIATVTLIQLVIPLVTGQIDALGIDHDNIVSGIDVGRIYGLVLALQNDRELSR